MPIFDSVVLPSEKAHASPHASPPDSPKDSHPANPFDDEEHAPMLGRSSSRSSSMRHVDLRTASHITRPFYERQNSEIDGFRSIDKQEAQRLLDVIENEEQIDESLGAQRALWLSFYFNVFLFLAKLAAALTSNSLAVVASLVDSALDLFSGTVLYFSERAQNHRQPYEYPIGKTRLGPIGVIVFASVMGTASLQLIQESIKALVKADGTVVLSTIAIIVFSVTIFVKFVLFLYCRQFPESESVSAYAQDHLNDVISNTPSFLFAFVASSMPGWWFLDAVAALLVSLYILHTWVQTARENVAVLMGQSAPPDVLRKLTYQSLVHCEDQVLVLDTVRAFHFGGSDVFQVEVDIVLPEDMPLKKAHDIGEELQVLGLYFNIYKMLFRLHLHLSSSTSPPPQFCIRSSWRGCPRWPGRTFTWTTSSTTHQSTRRFN
jgi:cation diffusion facilitator family transporter